MSDERLRELERTVAEDPLDSAASAALSRERARVGHVRGIPPFSAAFAILSRVEDVNVSLTVTLGSVRRTNNVEGL